MIVALNKMDRQSADPDRVKQQLAEIGLVPDEWDGDTIIVPLSAKENEGLEDLLEAILLVADNMEILANPEGETFGTVIEGQRERGRGVVATLLVQNGSLKNSDVIVAGFAQGRLRALFDYRGNRIEEAGPSIPVSVMGLSDVPAAGDLFRVVESDREARNIVKERQIAADEQAQARKTAVTLEQIFERFQAGEARELRPIIKADVQGSLEPIVNSLEEMEVGEIGVNILHADTGEITEGDIMLAATSDAIVIGFNTQADTAAQRLAETEGISIRSYNIIYRLTEDVEKALKGMLEPEERQVVIGRASVLAVFPVSKLGQIAGCRISDGEIRRNGKIRVLRNGEVIFEGEVASLKRHQEDVREVRQGFECGIGVRNFNDFEEGDTLECFVIEMVSAV
jgi:translation initiation factor IF-2